MRSRSVSDEDDDDDDADAGSLLSQRKISTHTTRTKSRIYARYDNIE
jgi:hypothetical protein